MSVDGAIGAVTVGGPIALTAGGTADVIGVAIEGGASPATQPFSWQYRHMFGCTVD